MLQFGTSGLRGLVQEMTDQECYINTKGFVEYLLASQQIQPGSGISLAGDLRGSTSRILRAVGFAVQACGCRVEFCGRIPTPALAYYAMQNRQASIMVTGSHIPDDRNGIKFYRPFGEILKSEEQDILQQVACIRAQAENKAFDAQGCFLPGVSYELPAEIQAAEQAYVQRYQTCLAPRFLLGKTIVVDQHSAVGRDLLVRLLQAAGANVIPEGRSESFVAKDTENITPETRINFRRLAEIHRPFAVVSLDGDSDRPFLADEQGEFYSGDVLGAVVARFLHAKFAAVPISANDAIDPFLHAAQIEHVQTRIGSPYVIAALNKAIEGYKHPAVGWEVNGGFLLGSDIVWNGGSLKALPTRDAVLPILCALQAALAAGSVSRLFAQLPKRYTAAGLADSFPMEISRRIIQGFGPVDPTVLKIEYGADEMVLEHADGRQTRFPAAPVPAAPMNWQSFWKNPPLSRREYFIRELLEKYYFPRHQGFGRVVRIQTMDGIRITFDNAEVIHLRPSGNAPQFRIYANAPAQNRADELVRMCLAQGGILQKMEENIKVSVS